MRVSGLYVYPIKSCSGIVVRELHLRSYGPEYDRQFVIADEKTGRMITQRECPRLCLIETAFVGDSLEVRIPSRPTIHLPLDGSRLARERKVVVWDDVCRGFDEGDVIAGHFSNFLERRCRLVRYARQYPRMRMSSHLNEHISVSFADGYPLLVISEESLCDLNRRIRSGGGRPVEMRRFRPNIVIKCSMSYVEDTVQAIMVNGLVLRGAKRCTRCSITLVDPRTGALGKEPLRTLETYRRFGRSGEVAFGRNFVHVHEGVIRQGDLVRLHS